jgi:hypothetical protein
MMRCGACLDLLEIAMNLRMLRRLPDAAADMAGAVLGLGDIATTAAGSAIAGAAITAAVLGRRRSLRISASRTRRGVSFSAELAAPAIGQSRDIVPGARVLIGPDGLPVNLAELAASETDYLLRRAGAVSIDGQRLRLWATSDAQPAPLALAATARHLRRMEAAPIVIEVRGAGWWTAAAPAGDAVELLYRAADVLPTVQAGWSATECPPPAVDGIDMTRSIVLRAEDDGRLIYQHIGPRPRAILGDAWAAASIGRPEAGAPDPEYSEAACSVYREVLETGRTRVDAIRATVRRSPGADPILLGYRRVVRRLQVGRGRLAVAVTTWLDPQLALRA